MATNKLHTGAIDGGAGYGELFQKEFSVIAKYPRLYGDYKATTIKPRDPKNETDVWVLWGEAGGDKSKRAWKAKEAAEAKGIKVYWRSAQENSWWSNYEGEKMVVLEEFDWKTTNINHLKCWLDRYPCKVAGKGTNYMELAALQFIITCQESPLYWYRDRDDADRKAVIRRIHHIVHVPSVNDTKSLIEMFNERSDVPTTLD